MKKQNQSQSATAAEINPEIHGQTKREAQGIAKRYRCRCIDLERQVAALEAVAEAVKLCENALLRDETAVDISRQSIALDKVKHALANLAAVRGQKVEGGK